MCDDKAALKERLIGATGGHWLELLGTGRHIWRGGGSNSSRPLSLWQKPVIGCFFCSQCQREQKKSRLSIFCLHHVIRAGTSIRQLPEGARRGLVPKSGFPRSANAGASPSRILTWLSKLTQAGSTASDAVNFRHHWLHGCSSSPKSQPCLLHSPFSMTDAAQEEQHSLRDKGALGDRYGSKRKSPPSSPSWEGGWRGAKWDKGEGPGASRRHSRSASGTAQMKGPSICKTASTVEG